MTSSVPVIDLAPWFGGDEAARTAVAAQVDAALQSVGFFLASGHGVPEDLRARVRAEAREFFALPREAKQRYAVTVGGRAYHDIPNPATVVGAALEASSFHPARSARNHLRILCAAAGFFLTP